MENHRMMMREFLFENLRDLMVKHVFEKITIKMICDETGVIRATFYNYFDDKYDCLNAIIHHDLVENAHDSLLKHNAKEVLTVMFETVQDNRAFYRVGYNVVGPNGFEALLQENLALMVNEFFEESRDDLYLPQYSNSLLANYYAQTLAYSIKTLVFEKDGVRSVEDAVNLTLDLMQHSFVDFVKE